MTLLRRYDPFAELAEFPTFRLFEDTVDRLLSEPASTRPWAPAVDIMEDEEALVLKADIPDIKLELPQIKFIKDYKPELAKIEKQMDAEFNTLRSAA